MSDLARRLAEHPRFEWRVGMYAITRESDRINGIRLYWPVCLTKGFPGPMGVHNGGNCWPVTMHGPYFPDLTDPATAGVLLGRSLE